MGAIIPLVAILRHRRLGGVSSDGGANKKRGIAQMVPLFVLGFIAFALIRTAGDTTLSSNGRAFGLIRASDWGNTLSVIKAVAVYSLVTALAGVGLRLRFSRLAKLGIKPFLAGFAAAFSVGVVSFGLVKLLGHFVKI